MAMLSVEEALGRVLAMCEPLPTEVVAIDEAIGRALASDVIAQRTLPPWDNSAMDGYAVRAGDAIAGARLKVVERIFAGQKPSKTIGAGECARIMTGARVPAGADAVVMQERTAANDAEVEILEQPKPGANIRRRGEDVAEGARLFAEGTCVGLAEAGALWGQGLTTVSVRRRPAVAIASSGDELCDVGADPRGRIVDTNSPVIAQAVKRAGGVPTRLGVAPDELEAIVERFRRGLEHDVLITLAGASVGEKDFTREAFSRLGVEVDFWKVAMKPGKPLVLGRKGKTLVVGLPGNPVSAMVTFELFVRPALRKLQGLSPAPVTMPGRAAVDLPKAPGLRLFVRAIVEHRDGALWATPLQSQSSGAMASASLATHLVSLPPDSSGVKKGSEIELIELRWGS